MNRSGVEILWDDEEADINGFMLEACGINSTDFLLILLSLFRLRYRLDENIKNI